MFGHNNGTLNLQKKSVLNVTSQGGTF